MSARKMFVFHFCCCHYSRHWFSVEQLKGRIVNQLSGEITDRKDHEIIGEEGKYDIIHVSTLLEAAGVNISKDSLWSFLFIGLFKMC